MNRIELNEAGAERLWSHRELQSITTIATDVAAGRVWCEKCRHRRAVHPGTVGGRWRVLCDGCHQDAVTNADIRQQRREMAAQKRARRSAF